ncbi:MAG: ABC transporter permease [Chloroflexi bacterium]|nr:MAG: ABC transporter permease [Chloroflexota bacterium]
MQNLNLSNYLAFKEILRNRGRFLLIGLVIALITLLVLFIAALGEGLGNGNREYISKLDAQLLLYAEKSDYLIASSRLERNVLSQVRRVEGVAGAGPIATSNTAVILPGDEVLKVSLLGVEPGQPGEPPVVEGRQLSTDLAREVLIDRNVVVRTGLKVGDTITLRSSQGTQDEFYTLQIVGVMDGQSYSLAPSVILPYFTWDRVRPKSEAELQRLAYTTNVIAVRLNDPEQIETVSARLQSQVAGIEVADIPTAIANVPGYTAQQSTLQTQGGFTLLIGVLVIGGFFQIQVLQKVPQIGVLKAIGAANQVVALASIIQIGVVTTFGVAVGAFLSYLFSLSFPPTVPIVFNGTTSAFAVIALLLIGPIGGIVSVRYAVRIEPLKALRLA